jgi:hypothetical protein
LVANWQGYVQKLAPVCSEKAGKAYMASIAGIIIEIDDTV